MNCLGGSVSVAKKRKANRMEVLSKRDRNWVQTSSIELQTEWRDLDAKHKMFGKISILLTANNSLCLESSSENVRKNNE